MSGPYSHRTKPNEMGVKHCILLYLIAILSSDLTFSPPDHNSTKMRMPKLASISEEESFLVSSSTSPIKTPSAIEEPTFLPNHFVKQLPQPLRQDLVATKLLDSVGEIAHVFLLFETPLALLAMGMFALCW